MRNQKEHCEQVALFQWAETVRRKYPELRWMFAIPNGGARHIAVAIKLKAEGVKAGVPDIFLPVARSDWNGLFIEMKSGKNKPSDRQIDWKNALTIAGYKSIICYGWEDAKGQIEYYLDNKEPIL